MNDYYPKLNEIGARKCSIMIINAWQNCKFICSNMLQYLRKLNQIYTYSGLIQGIIHRPDLLRKSIMQLCTCQTTHSSLTESANRQCACARQWLPYLYSCACVPGSTTILPPSKSKDHLTSSSTTVFQHPTLIPGQGRHPLPWTKAFAPLPVLNNIRIV